MKRVMMLPLAVALALAPAACHSDASGSAGGTLTVRLTAGGPNDGALVVTISGGPITAVHGAGGYQIASQADAEGTHFMVVGDIGVGALATIDVPNVADLSSYVATVDQAADRNSFALLDPATYRVGIARAP